MIGMPSSVSIASHTETKSAARLAMRSQQRLLARLPSESAQSRSEIPIVTVRMSRRSSEIISIVSRILLAVSIVSLCLPFVPRAYSLCMASKIASDWIRISRPSALPTSVIVR